MKWPEIIAKSSPVRQQLDRLWCTLRSLLARGVRCARHCYQLAAELCSLLLAGQPVVPLIVKLAAKNLFFDRLRFIATIIGIVFSIVLVNVQMGLFVSFGPHGDHHDRSFIGRFVDRAARHPVVRGSRTAR